MRGLLRITVISSLTYAASLPMLAQTGTVGGRLRDPNGAPVANATILIKNVATGAVIQAKSNTSGQFQADTAAGSYDLSVPFPCCLYGTYSYAGLAVRDGGKLDLNITIPWGTNLGTEGDDPLGVLDEIRAKRGVPTGPAPRTPDGKPDLSGLWINRAPDPAKPQMPAPMQPWAATLAKQRTEANSKDAPGTYCMPNNPVPITVGFPYKFVQSPQLIVMLQEYDTPGYRQIYLDGRAHPKDWNPTWMGHAVGRWEGDTLVVDTVGYNDKSWFGLPGIPHTEQLHVVERIRRPDLGHLEVEVDIEDPGAFTSVWKRTVSATLAPGEDIMEFICAENNRDSQHMVGK
jgi:Carboxypeptidase regulatory-like domain